jgi:hypothetical protein
MTWNVVRAPGREEFIISDHPVHIHDPRAYPDRPGGWFSSPLVQVTFPVDRKALQVSARIQHGVRKRPEITGTIRVNRTREGTAPPPRDGPPSMHSLDKTAGQAI